MAGPATTPNILVIALRSDLPPMSFLGDKGQPAGIMVDMWKLWAQKTGREIEFRLDTWQNSFEALKKGQVDIAGSLSSTPERQEWMAFSQPIYVYGLSFFFLKDQGTTRQSRDLKGQKVGVVAGTYPQEILRRYFPDIEGVAFATAEEILQATRDGTTKAFLGNQITSPVMFRKLGVAGEFQSSEQHFFPTTLHAGIPKKNQELLALVDRGFDLMTDAELAEIEQRWVADPKMRYYRQPTSSPRAEGQQAMPLRLTTAEEAWLKKHKTVTITLPAVFPPLMFTDGGKPVQGIVPDILEIFSSRTGINFIREKAPLADLSELLQTRRTDLFPAFMDLGSDPSVDRTEPCFNLTWEIINRTGAPFILDVSDLAWKKVTVVKDVPIFKRLQRDYPTLNIHPADTPLEALRSVQKGEADAFIGALVVAGHVIQKYQLVGLKIAGRGGYEDFPFTFAVRSDWPELVSILNKTIHSISPEEKARIFDKWMPVSFEQAVSWQTAAKWFFLLGGGLGTILLLTLYWNRRMAREILHRKKAEAEQTRLLYILESSLNEIYIFDPESLLFLYVNRAALGNLGYTSEAMLVMTPLAIKPEHTETSFRRTIAPLLGDQPQQLVIFTTVHRRADGSLYPVEVHLQLVKFEGQRMFLAMILDITERKQLEKLLTFLAQTSKGTEDMTFFEVLARYLAESLGMDFICIDRMEGDGLAARTVAVWSDGKFEDNVSYALKDTPCGEVVGKQVCCFPEGVCELFPHDQVLRDLRAESYVGVTLFDHTGQPNGLIAIISRKPLENRDFTETVLKIVAVRAGGELEWQQAEDALQTSLAEKEMLLKEVHHRVKNNLAAIMGLVDMQGQTLTDEVAKGSMAELSVRIRSMALVHEQLYHSNNLARIDFQEYLRDLVSHLQFSYDRTGNIEVSVAATGVTMGLDNAVPCGLLITELVTNAFKYAFPAGQARSGANLCEINVAAEWDDAGYTLTVADNGVGLPADFDWTKTETLGLLLVAMLSQHQLQGKMEVDCAAGTRFRLRFTPKK